MSRRRLLPLKRLSDMKEPAPYRTATSGGVSVVITRECFVHEIVAFGDQHAGCCATGLSGTRVTRISHANHGYHVSASA